MKRNILTYLILLISILTVRAQQYIANTEQLHVAVIMPFCLEQSQQSIETQKAIDFYKGVLMTVDSLKRAGISVYVLALDEGPASQTKIQTIVQNPLLKEADVIIGPGRNADISPLATFAQTNHIPLAIPFANTTNIAGGRPYVFQCNTHQSAHYTKVFDRFVKHNSADNILFVEMNDKAQKDTFHAEFTKHLSANSVKYSRINFSDFDDNLTQLLDSTRNNILIPSSSSAKSFDMLCLKMNDMNLSATYRIQLMGTPEWQTLPAKSQKNMYTYSATFFTTFYNNNLSTRTKEFIYNFRSNFRHDQYASYPRYGEMGHDISAFFLTAIQRYGSQLFDHIGTHDYNSLQLPLHFTRPDRQNGFTNQATYMIYYKPTGDVILSTF